LRLIFSDHIKNISSVFTVKTLGTLIPLSA
jgi:hypothetical protein